MNDIQLQKLSDNKYDWVFRDDDLAPASVYDRTRNRVVHSLMLHRNESELAWYKDKGSEIYSFVKDEQNSETRLLLEEEIRMVCNSIEDIAYTDVDLTYESGGAWTMNIRVTRNDGITVII